MRRPRFTLPSSNTLPSNVPSNYRSNPSTFPSNVPSTFPSTSPLPLTRRRLNQFGLIAAGALALPIRAAATGRAATVPAVVSGTFPGTAVRYPVVQPGMPLTFPGDHGAHPAYRIEWWYVTGWLFEAQGRQPRGFQITFFRIRTEYPDGNPSRFAPSRLVAAHAALVETGEGRHRHSERLANLGSPGVLLAEGDCDCRLPRWTLRRDGDDRYHCTVQEPAFDWTLELVPALEPWRQGEAGYSRKGPAAQQASYYYSRPQLRVSGKLRPATAGAGARPVTGTAWLDHEWSSAPLADDAAGWDWAGLNLHDGRALTWYRVRARESAAEPQSHYLALRAADGQVRRLAAPQVRIDQQWQSGTTGARYPIALTLIPAEAPETSGFGALKLRPLIAEQEIDSRQSTGNVYWEGAVRVFDQHDREIGLGYLELTGYHRGIRL